MKEEIDETTPCPHCMSADTNKDTPDMELIDKKERKYKCPKCGNIDSH